MNKYNELIKHMREPTLEENLAIQKNIDKISAEDKREILYDFMMDLVERANKNIVRDNI